MHSPLFVRLVTGWRVEYGGWSMEKEDGRWRMQDGRWRIDYGLLGLETRGWPRIVIMVDNCDFSCLARIDILCMFVYVEPDQNPFFLTYRP